MHSVADLLHNTKFKDPLRNGSLDELEALVAGQGLRSALIYLNALVPHRFTAIYRLRHKTLYCTSAFDAAQEISGVDLAEVPYEESYCQFTLKDGRYVTADAAADPLLEGHKYRDIMQSYVGMPVLDENAQVYGTLCHFDFLKIEAPPRQIEFLKSAAQLLEAHVGRPVSGARA